MKTRTYSFGYWLRRRRKALDLTQRALALAVSCSEDAIRKIEADERRPSRRLAERIADRLAIAAEERAAFLDAARAVHSSGALAVDDDPQESVGSTQTNPVGRDSESEGTATDSPLTSARPFPGSAGATFVGRGKELTALQRLFDQLGARQGHIAMLAGEPGIGKTRTAQELAAYASRNGAMILWGRSYEGGGAPSYWPWVQALRGYMRDRGTEQLRAEIGSGASSIGEIVEDLRERLPEVKPAVTLEPEAARFRLFDATATLLRNLSRQAPVMLILDDLHWADQASLRLLEFVAAELAHARVFILGTYRDAEITRKHPLSRTLAEVTRLGAVHRTTLRGLDREEVARFVASMWPHGQPPAALVEAVNRQTEGNPLFVTEVVRMLLQEGRSSADRTIEEADWSVRIPDGVREVIGRRLDRLSERCNEVLTVAAVIGRHFALSQLAMLHDSHSEGELLKILEDAIEVRVIEEVPRTVDQFQFTHALIGETLAGELTATRRVRLHEQIGNALEALYGEESPAHAAELAHHFTQAAMLTGSEKLIHYSAMAGERALAMHAYEEALGHYERALAAKGSQPADTQTAAILFGLGRAQLATLERHRYVEAARTLRRAFACFMALSDTRGAVNVAELSFPHFPGVETEIAQIVHQAIALVPDDSVETARLLSKHGRILGISDGDYDGAQVAFERSIAIAKRTGNQSLEIRTLAAATCVDFFHLEHTRAIHRGERAAELTSLAVDIDAEVATRYWFASCLRSVGEFARFEAEAKTMLELAERLRNRFWLAGALWLMENVSRFRGDFAAARAYSDRGLEVSPLDIRLLATRTLMECETGHPEQGIRQLDRLVDLMSGIHHGSTPEHAVTAGSILVRASMFGLDHHAELAEREAKAVAGAMIRTPALRLLACLGLSMSAARRRDVEMARTYYPEIKKQAGTFALPTGICCDRVAGQLARTIGAPDEARFHFERAIERCREGKNRPEEAWSTFECASHLLEGGSADGRSHAQSLLEESHRIATELGMRPLRERIEELRK